MSRTTATLRRAFSGATVAWAGALPAAALAAAQTTPSVPTYLFALIVYAIGSAVCHQRPERSFALWGRQLPVCARCVGIYVGAAVAVVVFWAAGRRSPKRLRRKGGALLSALIASLPTVATLVFEWTTGITPSNWIRAAAGLVLGAAAAWLVLAELTATPEVN